MYTKNRARSGEKLLTSSNTGNSPGVTLVTFLGHGTSRHVPDQRNVASARFALCGPIVEPLATLANPRWPEQDRRRHPWGARHQTEVGSDHLTNVIVGTQPADLRDHLRESSTLFRPSGAQRLTEPVVTLIGYGTRGWNPARCLAFRYRRASRVVS